jgi:uncharacterized membrane protein YfhO
VNGQPAPIGRVDYTLIGVALPEGARTVELGFHSSPYELGKTVTLIALALSTLLILAGVATDRRGARG